MKPEFEELPVPKIVDVKHIRLQKDGTCYEVMAFKFEGDIKFGCLGATTDGYLVIEGLNRKAYLFKEGYKDSSYIYEKLCKTGYDLSIKDTENIQLVLGKMGIHKEP